ncbi:hypothetical protein C9424_00200 [Arthrobacter sp. H-02-3]|nr:hypothetical protein C9424_00200 [Arthrobacter sp. H-02-3]
MESRVVLFAQIRRDARVEGLSVRALAVRHGVHRRTVRHALESAAPPVRKPRQAVARRLTSDLLVTAFVEISKPRAKPQGLPLPRCMFPGMACPLRRAQTCQALPAPDQLRATSTT